MKKIIATILISTTSFASFANTQPDYSDSNIGKMFESLGYFSFQESFFLQCENLYPELKNDTKETEELLKPYKDILANYFTHPSAPVGFKEQYEEAEFKKVTLDTVRSNFDSGKYNKESCKFAIWSIKNEGIDPVIASYIKQ